MLNKDEFLEAYGHFLARYWQDASFKESADSDPVEALEKVGFKVDDCPVRLVSAKEASEDDAIRIEFGIEAENANDACYELYQKGIERNDLVIVIPKITDVIGAEELSDEELMSVAGGDNDSWLNLNINFSIDIDFF